MSPEKMTARSLFMTTFWPVGLTTALRTTRIVGAFVARLIRTGVDTDVCEAVEGATGCVTVFSAASAAVLIPNNTDAQNAILIDFNIGFPRPCWFHLNNDLSKVLEYSTTLRKLKLLEISNKPKSFGIYD